MNLQNNNIINSKNTHKYKIITESEPSRFYRIYILCIIIALIFFLKLCFIYFSQNASYVIEGESENFSYKNAIFHKSYNEYYFIHGNAEIKNQNINIISVELKCNDRLIVGSSDFLHGVSTEAKGYDELFPKEVVKNIKNWKIEVAYELDENKYVEIIQLDAKKD